MAPMTPEELAGAGLEYAVTGDVATVTLARPEVHNAQTPAMWRALASIGEQVPDSVRVVVVRGEGPSFSAGLDRAMLDPAGGGGGPESVAGLLTRPDAEVDATIDRFQRGFTWLRDPRFISVAVVHGHAIGAGFQLALACDVRIAATDAQFTMAEPSLGLVPDLGGTQVLVDLVGYSRALEICATGRRVGADEAREIGLVTAVVPPADLAAAVDDFVEAVAAAPHGAVSMTKALLLGARDRSYADQLLAERQAQLSRIRSLAEDLRGSESHA